MTFVKGGTAPNRRLPPDDILLAEMAAGLSDHAIARKYDLVRCTVSAYIARKGWRPKAVKAVAAAKTAPTEAKEAVKRRYPVADACKIVRKRTVMADSRDFKMVDLFISLPRITAIHGPYQGA